MAQSLNNIGLANKIRVRKKFLDKIITSIIQLVANKGKIINRVMGSSSKHIVQELRNFGGFSFYTDLGQTMFGGNTIKVYHHPGQSFCDGGLDLAQNNICEPVLDVYFQTADEYDVCTFNESKKWQRALIRVLKNQDKIAAQLDRKENKLKNKSEKEEVKRLKEERLQEEARRLGVRSQ
jgi:hypothetical protein